jgi:5-methyltetrahydropteroyltriglutamate--homocysteine methyltransferase
MKRSTDRVLTTHTGSLPRPDDLAALHVARQEKQSVDEDAFEARITSAIDEIVARQVDVGIDVVSDGEMSKNGYIDYTAARLSGFSGSGAEHGFYFGDLLETPELTDFTYRDTHLKIPTCDGPISYIGQTEVARDIANFKAALDRHPATEAFMPAASPGIVAACSPNEYYPTYDEYVLALAAAMNTEYRAIADAGLIVQVDAPDLALGADFHTWMWPEIEKRGFEALAELHAEAINVALEGVPVEQARLHLCWANYMGPHTHDYPLRDVLRPTLRVNVTAVNFEAANPAHAHEWELFTDVKIPDGKVLIPGVIDTKTNVVEHPRAVAQRIVQYARIVGQENVIAGTDCGFGTFVGLGTVHPVVTWLKIQSLVEGAAIASKELASALSTA